MRCPNCNKFVPFNTEEDPDAQEGPEIDSDGSISLEVRRMLSCEECGTELKEGMFDFSDFHLQPEGGTDLPDCTHPEGHDFADAGVEATPTMNTKGKGRGMKTFYGVEVEVRATCSHCKVVGVAKANDQMQASSFDEL